MRSNESPSGAFKRQSGLRKQMEGLCPDKLCGVLQTYFHGRGRKGEQVVFHLRSRPLRHGLRRATSPKGRGFGKKMKSM